MRITILGSGSSGNCALIETPRTRLLLDAGLSARQVCERLQQVGCSIAAVDAIVLTHEHTDHWRALPVLCRNYAFPVYANRLTAEALVYELANATYRPAWHLFTNGQAFSIADLTIEPFSVSHDAADPGAFVLHHADRSVGFVTDLGCATRLVKDHIRAVDALVLESNHDVQLLQNDLRRPWSTKQRIMSRHGHLSNEAAAALAAEVLTDRLRHIMLAHLSRDCNRPELAARTMRSMLQQHGATHVQVSLSNQDTPATPIQV